MSYKFYIKFTNTYQLSVLFVTNLYTQNNLLCEMIEMELFPPNEVTHEIK